MSKEHRVSGNTHNKEQLNHYANQHNPNNSAYQANRDNRSNQCNPNNKEYVRRHRWVPHGTYKCRRSFFACRMV